LKRLDSEREKQFERKGGTVDGAGKGKKKGTKLKKTWKNSTGCEGKDLGGKVWGRKQSGI